MSKGKEYDMAVESLLFWSNLNAELHYAAARSWDIFGIWSNGRK